VVTPCKDPVHVLICQRLQVSEASPGLSVSKAKLPISIASTYIDVSSLCHHNRMIQTSGHKLDLLLREIGHESRLVHVFVVAVAELSMLAKPKAVKAAIYRQNHRVLGTTSHCFNSWSLILEQI